MRTAPSNDEFPPIDLPASEPEVVDLAAIDLDFAGDEARHTNLASAKAAGGIATGKAAAVDLAKLELFRGVGDAELAAFSAAASITTAAPGCVLQGAGKNVERVFFVVAGELRLYGDVHEKRSRGIVDAGQSVGLSWALLRQPSEVSIVATERARVLELTLSQLDEFARRSHTFACNYNGLLASYLRGDNCLNAGARALAALHQRQGYTDELTLLHNQRWLDAMLPRLLSRNRFDKAPLTLTMFWVDHLEKIEQEFGTVAAEQVLAAVGQLMLDLARTTDLLVFDVSRHFVGILPNTTIEGATIFCRRVQDRIRSLKVDITENQSLPSLTLSCGAVQRVGDESSEQLLTGVAALVQRSIDRGGNFLSE